MSEFTKLSEILRILYKDKKLPWKNHGWKIRKPTAAIRIFCLGCCGGDSSEVKNCTALDCFLYPFRMGKNPFYNPDVKTYAQGEENGVAEILPLGLKGSTSEDEGEDDDEEG